MIPDADQSEIKPVHRIGGEAPARIEIRKHGDRARPPPSVTRLIIELHHRAVGFVLVRDYVIVGEEKARPTRKPVPRPSALEHHPTDRVGGQPPAREKLDADEIDRRSLAPLRSALGRYDVLHTLRHTRRLVLDRVRGAGNH